MMDSAPEQNETVRSDGGGPRLNYADTVLFNGKVVSMDDDGINTHPGSIYDGLVIRDGKIVELTSSSDHEPWIGSETKQIDLEGQTVIPGIIDPHSHLHEFATRMLGPSMFPDRFSERLNVLKGDYEDAEDLLEDMLATIERRTEELDEGELIVVMPYRYLYYTHLPEEFIETTAIDLKDDYRDPTPDDDIQSVGGDIFREGLIDKETLDDVAPNHKVLFMSHPYYLPNERLNEWYEKQYGLRPGDNETVDLYRVLLFDYFLEEDPEKIGEIIEAGQEIYLMNGTTTIGTHVYPMSALDGYLALDRQGAVQPRVAWGANNLYVLNSEKPTYHKRVQQFRGYGSEFLWNGGVSLGGMDGGPPAIATTLDAPPEVKDRELHAKVEDGSGHYEALKEIVKRGARFACSNHALGDRAVDRSIQALVEASHEAGLTDEEIRERNHALDHGGLYPRPDQVDIAKKYNIRLNLNMYEVWRLKIQRKMLEPYPEEAARKAENWMAAAKTALDAGLKVGWHGRELQDPFREIAAFVTREYRGHVLNKDLAIDRVKALKMATTWNGEYLLREDLGSLEPGNRADLLVLNHDYLEVPETELKEISPLLTMVNGEIHYRNGI